MMKQFRSIKEQYPDALLLFRCGDFYETYAEDAVRAAKILNITLTKRNNGGGAVDSTAMAGFPFHALDTYLPKLVRAGMRVAICDQLEDPKLAKGLVQRGVTELVTPGASYNDASFGQKENNWLCCLHFVKTSIGISLLDLSTGEYLVAQGTSDYIATLLTKFAPKEVLFMRGKRQEFERLFGTKYFTFELEDWMLNPTTAEERLRKQFETTNLKGFGVTGVPDGIVAAAGILHYLDITQHLQTKHIHPLSRLETDKYVWRALNGGVYGQYATRITGSYLFHSVPYYRQDKSTLETGEYNKLGSRASAGCVRLCVRDVKWIYDHCASGTIVTLYDDSNLQEPLMKPNAIRIPTNSRNAGWDPTDPDGRNPW